MYRIGICDDNIAVGAEIEKYLLECASTENFEDMEIEVFLNGKDLCRAIRNNSNIFHLLFLDIELGDLDGISVGNILREEMKNEITQVVFISYTQEYAMQLFKVRPMDFLITRSSVLSVKAKKSVLLRTGKRLCFMGKWQM